MPNPKSSDREGSKQTSPSLSFASLSAGPNDGLAICARTTCLDPTPTSRSIPPSAVCASSLANVGDWWTLTSLTTIAGASPSSSANFAASLSVGNAYAPSHQGCALASGTSTSVTTPLVP